MKKTLKKMLCGVCSAAMLMGAVTFSASAAAAFTDVKPTDYFAKPVEWAVQNGITAGVSDTQFGPNQSCTRAQAMTFLWAAAGRPEPTTSANFSDVKSTDYFAKAVAWAVENGITAGVGGGKFGANQPCTRGQIMTFLWRFGGSEEIQGGASFSDVSSSDYFAKPVAWAVKNEVTAGIGGGKFGPNQTCTRGQIMTMLWRADQIDVPVVPEPEKPTEPAPTEPAPTEPMPTEPAPTEPEVTEPAPTEPEVTEPTCEHKWVEGAYERTFVCHTCEWSCNTSDAERAGLNIGVYYSKMHKEQVEGGLAGHSYGEYAKFNPFSLHPNLWKCSECGDETEVDPAPHKHDWIPADGIWICRICDKVVIDDPYGGHDHVWVHEHFDEIGHQDNVIECSCGAQIPEVDAKKLNMSLEEYWKKHHADPLVAIGGGNHTNQGIKNMWVVDTPAYDTWTCSECGKVENVDPNQA